MTKLAAFSQGAALDVLVELTHLCELLTRRAIIVLIKLSVGCNVYQKQCTLKIKQLTSFCCSETNIQNQLGDN